MNIKKALLGVHGVARLIPRIRSIIGRFGLTSAKYAAFMDQYSLVARQTGCTATLPIPAVLLEKHPDLVRRYEREGH